MTIHRSLAAGRWRELTRAQQLGNIGSEYTRARKWEEKNNHEQRQRALERALELIDLTLEHDPNKEICRLRELTGDLYLQSHLYSVSLKELEDYTTQFVIYEHQRN